MSRKRTGNAPGKPPRAMILATRAQVLKQYVAGHTKEQIAESLGMPVPRVEKYLTDAMDSLVKHWAKPSPEHTFVRYASFQMGVIQKLQSAYDRFMKDDDGRHHGACISALKAQSEIMDKVLTKGQDFGIITREKADKSIRLSKADLRTELKNEIELLASLLSEVDNHDTFKRRRARHLDGKPKRRYLARIRKVKRNSLGFVTALPDWKFKKEAHDEAGGIIKQARPIPPDHPTIIQQSATQIDISITEDDDSLFTEYERTKQRKANAIEATAHPTQPQQQQTAGYEQATHIPLK